MRNHAWLDGARSYTLWEGQAKFADREPVCTDIRQRDGSVLAYWVDYFRQQADQIAKMQAEIVRLSTQAPAPRELPEDIASTIRQDLDVLQGKLKDARMRIDVLESEKLEVW